MIVELPPKVPGRWAIVHLTYQPESDPPWPRVQSFADWNALVEEASRMAQVWEVGF